VNRILILLFVLMQWHICYGQDFPPAPRGTIRLPQMPMEAPIEQAFMLRALDATILPSGLILAGSVEVRCRASWNDSARFRTLWEPVGGWTAGQRFCRATITALEGPNENAGAGWARILQANRTYVQLGCRAAGGSIFDQYRSWIRARIDVYTVPAGEPATDCQSSGDIGAYY
jgi:hypothetical protein